MTPEQRKAAAQKAVATKQANRARATAYAEFMKSKARQLAKAEALAADHRGEANTRAVALAMAEKLREARPPGFPPGLPSSWKAWEAMRRRPR